MEEVSFRLADVRGGPRLGEGTQPFDSPVRRHAVLRAVLGRGHGGSELLQPLEVCLVADATPDVLEGEISHLTLDPGPVDRDGPAGPTERRYDPGDDPVVKLDPADLRENRRLPRLVGKARLRSPGGAWLRMELAVASVGERPVASQTPATDALEEARQQVHSTAVVRSAAASLRPPHVLDPRPEIVRDRRSGTPGCRTASLTRTAVSADPAVVERVLEDAPDAIGIEAGLGRQLLGADVPQGVALEQIDGDADRGGVDFERVWGFGEASEAEGRMAARVVMVVELRRVAVGDPLTEPAAIPFGARRLGDELVPVVRVGTQDPPVTHDEGDAGRVQAVLQQFEGPAEVALPAVGVPSQEEVEGPGTRLGEHLRHRRRTPDGRAAVGDLEGQAGVEKAVALDEAILLLALAGGPEAIVLAGRGFADPAGHAQSADVVERARQALHAAVSFLGGCIPVMFALPSRSSRCICLGPSGYRR